MSKQNIKHQMITPEHHQTLIDHTLHLYNLGVISRDTAVDIKNKLDEIKGLGLGNPPNEPWWSTPESREYHRKMVEKILGL